MSDFELNIKEGTFENMLKRKSEMGYAQKSWDEWFDHLFTKVLIKKPIQTEMEEVFEKLHYDKNYDDWVNNFALNLNDIWNEPSAHDLKSSQNSDDLKERSAIVIGAGPSVKKHNHLKLLVESDYHGSIICTDRMLIPCLKAGITPDRFPKLYVVTIDGAEILKKFYNDGIVKNYGNMIKGIFSTIIHPLTAQYARENGVKIHWVHSLFDYHEGKKSFNQLSALMVRAKNHFNGLPAMQTGGNVGTASWFIAWQILKCNTVGLIGINHSWDINDPWEVIAAHTNAPLDIDKNSPLFEKLFPKIYNPEFRNYCILDPVFQYYSNGLKEFISRSPEWLTTINATEGGCIFGERIKCTTFKDFLAKYKN